MMLNTTALAPMASARVTTAAQTKPWRLAQNPYGKAKIPAKTSEKTAAQRLVALLFVSLFGAEFDARLPLGVCAIQP